MAARIFSAPDGTLWQAWTVVPGEHADWPSHARRHLPDSLAGGWVCFESASEKRRLSPIPTRWDDCDEGELWGLCSSAEPVRRRLDAAALAPPLPA